MLRLAAAAVSVLCIAACTELPPAPGSGGASGGDASIAGNGGQAGIGGAAASGGMVGMGGEGGAGGVAIDPCRPEVEPFDNIEATDIPGLGFAEGSVSGACVMGSCSGSDPFDRWQIEPICAGGHSIVLRWTNVASDLDLYLSDSEDQQLAQSATPNTTRESITISLEQGTFYVVEVQAFDVAPAPEYYELEVAPSD